MIYELLNDEIRSERPVALATVIEGPPDRVGLKLFVRPGQDPVGRLGHPDLDRVVLRDVLGELAAGQTLVRHYGAEGQAREEAVSVFIESYAPPPQMLIFGAVDFTAGLAKVAKVLGYRVTVCDARPVFATRQRFPAADEVVVDWPHRLLERVGKHLGPRDAVCVLTHDPKFDVPAVIEALKTDVGYLGAMGSRRTHDDRTRRLLEEGVSAEELRAPDVPDRAGHRCPDAGGDRRLDLRRDHRQPHGAAGAEPARRESATSTDRLLTWRRPVPPAAWSGAGRPRSGKRSQAARMMPGRVSVSWRSERWGEAAAVG